jgi:heptosyltransferase I
MAHMMAKINRILIVRPSALGDVCRTVPVLASLRQAYPGSQIDWVVQDTLAPAVQGHPALDRVIEFPRARLARWWRQPRVAGEALRWLGNLRGHRYDLVFDCQGLGRSGLITLATGARRRVGFRSAKELGWLGYTARHREPTRHDGLPLHTVDRMLALLACEGIEPVHDMRLYVAEHEQRWWQAMRVREGWGQQPYVVLAPTSRWPSKQWPVANWRALIDPLRERGVQRVVILGAPNERRQIEGLLTAATERDGRCGVVDLVGATSIPQTMAAIAQAAMVIANDSAPLHIAVGLQRPCIGLFGPTDPASVGPYRREASVLRRCGLQDGQAVNFKDPALGDRLMRAIRPEDVLAKFDALRAAPLIEPMPEFRCGIGDDTPLSTTFAPPVGLMGKAAS